MEKKINIYYNERISCPARQDDKVRVTNDANVKNHVHYSCGNWHVDHGDIRIYPVEKTT